MSAKSPRIHTVLERPLYDAVELLARRHGQSLSQEVRDLVRAALELLEDRGLAQFGEERRRSFDSKRALSPAQARKLLKRPPKER